MLNVEDLAIELMMTPIVEEVCFSLDAGQCVALVGASGCGKTTVLRAIAGLIEPSKGRITNTFQRVAYLFQEPLLLPWRSAYENIALVGTGAVDAQRIYTLAALLHLDHEDLDKYPQALSGGMQQRVSLARALLTDPDLLIMDEPFSALDHQLRSILQNMIIERIEAGLAVCMVTHDREEALLLAQRMIRLAGSPALPDQILVLNTPYRLRDDVFIRSQLGHPIFSAIDFPND